MLIDTLYNDPDNLFVAGFIGTPEINRFPGRVEQDTVVLDCGVRFALSLQSKIATGTKIICGFRPHQISLSNEGVSVVVLLVEPTGEGQEMQLRTGDQDITIVTNDEPDTKVGQMVELSFDTSKVLLFEKRSEDRLR